MPEFQLYKFVEWVVWFAQDRDTNLTPIRIVKFLYLLDLYHARTSDGRTLTGWPWRFVHYGPFCGEALDAIGETERLMLIEGKPYRSRFKNDTIFYSHAGDVRPERFPDHHIKSGRVSHTSPGFRKPLPEGAWGRL